MSTEFREDVPLSKSRDESAEQVDNRPRQQEPNIISRWLEMLAQMGLGEGMMRLGTSVLLLIVVVVVVLLMQAFYRNAPSTANVQSALAAGIETAATPALEISYVPPPSNSGFIGIPRLANIHTSIPTRPRQEITTYTVQAGDTVFGIAEKFGLMPQTILWGNYMILYDDPHSLKPDQVLKILPVDGTYYQWQAGDGLNGVAKFFGVNAEDIVNYPTNELDAAAIGDYANPNIEPGTWLIIPGGSREFISWSAPVGVTRDNPAIAGVLGPGACGPVSGGAVGYGTFVWPSNLHMLSGYDYSPATNHYGIDIAGSTGDNIYAVDAGVIVYAGWNDWGYGYMIIVDHGTGWQSLYAHLSALYVGCGQSVGQGDTIGAFGSTGKSSGTHLHFELMHSIYSKVNPWDFLPAQ